LRTAINLGERMDDIRHAALECALRAFAIASCHF
jgi:hypothetical protein